MGIFYVFFHSDKTTVPTTGQTEYLRPILLLTIHAGFHFFLGSESRSLGRAESLLKEIGRS
jgi:hypothetical protein